MTEYISWIGTGFAIYGRFPAGLERIAENDHCLTLELGVEANVITHSADDADVLGFAGTFFEGGGWRLA
jgi:hypothetical protein